jgi:3-oxoacyl-(acyl-carrier-protein) synthase
MPIYLQSYSCTTAAGRGTEAFFGGLLRGRSFVRDGVARIPVETNIASSDVLVGWLTDCLSFIPPHSGRLGVIFSSTKGCIEDWIHSHSVNHSDPLTPVLDLFLRKSGLSPVRASCVSTACTSSHSALYLATRWLKGGVCDRVLICAADRMGRFVERGFRSLQAVCLDSPIPFSEARDGLGLGEGAAIVELSCEPSALELESVEIVTEGVSLTRPSPEGKGLKKVFSVAMAGRSADLIIAHATGTKTNDAIEDRVIQELAPSTPVTGTKWCVGHTMGVSGALDLIGAAESIIHQETFPIATLLRKDPSIQSCILTSILTSGETHNISKIDRVLVSSLGFGGMNAAMVLRKNT